MNLVGIETILPYKDVYEFKVYKYDDEIDLCNKQLFVCDIKVIITRVDEMYSARMQETIEVLGLVSNIPSDINKSSITDDLKDLILDEVWEEGIKQENIKLMFIES